MTQSAGCFGKRKFFYQLAHRLHAIGGLEHSPDIRTYVKEDIRFAIIALDCGWLSYGHIDGKHATWAQVYERVFGEPLELGKAMRKRFRA